MDVEKSTQVPIRAVNLKEEENLHVAAKQENAGAAFVLESKGTWLHAGYHLTSSTASPALLSLPYAMAGLGWVPGLVALGMGATISFYSYCLLSSVLEEMERRGHRFIRFRDLSTHILGTNWTSLLVTPLQFTVCFVTVVASILPGGQSIKAIYVLYGSNGSMKLYECIIIFGSVVLIVSQLPSFHSLRHINFISILLCLGYSLCAVCGSVIAGHSKQHQPASHAVLGSSTDKLFMVFNSLSIMSTTYGNAVIAEIQATIAPPVKGKMIKGLCLCYSIVLSTFFSVAVSGYLSFGNGAAGIIFNNMVPVNGISFVPRWLYLIANIFIILQLLAVAVIYMQPTFEVLEGKTADIEMARFSFRNFLPRLIARSCFVIIATILAAMLPFFGDINAVVGALGYTPLDFVFPILFHMIVFKPSLTMLTFWLNCVIIPVFTIVTLLGCLSSFRQIVLDAHTYKIFANI
eukprot:c18135_g1_i2 orf=321-1706(-)